MPPKRHVSAATNPAPHQTPPDDFLITSLLGGDSVALQALMDRYDRLVRYAILRGSVQRCRRDPQWLDSVASDTWSGFVQSLRRDPQTRPQSVRAYVVRIARNRTVSALRAGQHHPEPLELDGESGNLTHASDQDDPADSLDRSEWLAALRICLTELDADDRTLVSQLHAITERRWRDAASALDISESTLRSRWERILGRLRTQLQGKVPPEFFAPDRVRSD